MGTCDLSERCSLRTAEPQRPLAVNARSALAVGSGSGLRLLWCLLCGACLDVCCYCMVAVLFAL